ncbi:hypothetical protein [Silvibacterium acidisoli]|uniref:hypothetical protein n=1 Tax=Acidobacteriaceae bacterium ZG23-2 TaxID=2883246 RepID=UPI00406CC1E0
MNGGDQKGVFSHNEQGYEEISKVKGSGASAMVTRPKYPSLSVREALLLKRFKSIGFLFPEG